MINNGLGKIKTYGLWVKPQSLNITLDSLADENSGRTQDGVMRINWIYNRIRKLEITLPPMVGPEIAQILDKVQWIVNSSLLPLTLFNILSFIINFINLFTFFLTTPKL